MPQATTRLTHLKDWTLQQGAALGMTVDTAELTQRALDIISRPFNGGTMNIETVDGRHWQFGSGEPQAAIEIRDAAVLGHILAHPTLHFGEAYMDGLWRPAHGSNLLDCISVGLNLMHVLDDTRPLRMLKAGLGKLAELNDPSRSQANVAHHYDLDATLYRKFLDEDMHYSCAYFRTPDMSLEAAQQAKCEHIARKLDLQPGARVLDIGCGWGGMAMYLAQHYGASVTGITLSVEQHQLATQRAAERGLGDRVRFILKDYRLMEGEFDAIVSVGMFEHVGRPQYATFFNKVRELLKPEGTALIHTIGRERPPAGTNAWIRKYIFPGGYIPAASEINTAVEQAGLLLSDLEVWRLHYAETLKHWNQRFQQQRKDMEAHLGQRFARMWTFYLQACEAAFRVGDTVVFHYQLSKDLNRLPLTRDYLYR